MSFMQEQMNEFEGVINDSYKIQDQTVESGERVLPPAGETVGRLVSYVELGSQMFQFKGKDVGTYPAVSIGFELLHPKKNIIDGKGQFLNFPMMKISLNSKARFYKLFNAMRYGREDIKHMAQMMGEAFRLTIEHSEDGKYANIVTVSKPYTMDMDSGEEKKINVPHFTRALQLFIWNNPNMKCWDSIYIDGEFTKEDGTIISKNWLQGKIKDAKNFSSSSVAAMLSTISEPSFDDPFESTVDEDENTDASSKEEDIDELSALGL